MKVLTQIAIVAAAAAAAVLPVDSLVVERRFSTTVYPAIQRFVTPLSNRVPFALFDLLTIAAVVVVVALLIRWFRHRREGGVRSLLAACRRMAVAGAVVYLVFLGLWGLNYRRLPMTDRLAIDAAAPDSDAVLQLGLRAVDRLNALYDNAHRAGWPMDPRDNRSLLEAFVDVQGRLSDAPPAVPGRLKQTLYGPYFRWTSVDGMVNPFGLEVMANPDLLPFERPFVAAHEWAHLAGYAHEAEASFVGWLACVRADEPSQYSAWQYLYWQVSADVSVPQRTRLRDGLLEGPRRDLDAIVERVQRGQLRLVRRAGWAVYDQYLRANRVDEGIRSYGEVVTLLIRARFDERWTPARRPAPSSR